MDTVVATATIVEEVLGRARTAQGLRRTAVVDGFSFSIRRGECYALLGPNGAGKTTTLRCCLGLTQPDGGTIDLVGRAGPARGAARTHPRRRGAADRQPRSGFHGHREPASSTVATSGCAMREVARARCRSCWSSPAWPPEGRRGSASCRAA